jgi:type III secretion system YscQ/HrcQ family protein
MAVRPFPYASLPKLTRRQQQLLNALRACWETGYSERALEAARSVLGSAISFQVGIGEQCSALELGERCAAIGGVALLIEQTQPARPLVCVIELTHEAAQQLVDLALGGDAVALPSPAIAALDDLSRGALAYVIARVLAALGGAWTLRNISELAQLSAAAMEDCVVYPIVLQLGHVSVTLRAYIPERLSLQTLPERPATRSLHALGVTLVATAGRTRMPLSAVRELTQGDVLLLDECALARQGQSWRGQVSAGLQGSRNHLQCTIEEQGLRVELHDAKESPMSTGHVHKADITANISPISTLGSDAPIELQIEIARFSLSLGELQRLQTGDVLSTGRRIGERVRVSVGGQSFAEGELVDVEGEVGVRLLSFNQPLSP